ncbi:MAG: (d)CMP kinase [Chloroflexi bacterium]|nr:(d)CMP kinase [Chloroflexota bacterium]
MTATARAGTPARRVTAAVPDVRIAIDGPGSSGKSSVGMAAALILGLRFVDTGLLYRALAWLATRRGIALDDGPGVAALAPDVELAPDADGRLARVRVDGRDVTRSVRAAAVDRMVSEVARQPDVRTALVSVQRRLAADAGIVMVGRDIGTVVLPGADLKVYLDASAAERARRRALERGLDPEGPETAAIRADLERRDAVDSGRAIAPLRPADDAIVLVTDGMPFDVVVEHVVELARARLAAAAADGVEGRGR